MNIRDAAFVFAFIFSGTAWAASIGDSLERPALDVGSLDINGDGVVNTIDWSLLTELADEAERVLGNRPNPLAVPLYEGMGEHSHASLFGLAKKLKDTWDLSAYDPKNIRRLLTEARWLASQIRITQSFSAQPDKLTPLAGILNVRFPGYSNEAMKPKEICEAIQFLDTKALRTHDVGLTAVFDLDKTVWAGHGIDFFLSALVQSGFLTNKAQAPMVDALAKLDGLERLALEANTLGQNAHLVLKHTTDPSLAKEARLSRKDGFFLVTAMLAGMSHQDAYKVAERAMQQGTDGFPALQGKLFDDPSGCSMRRIIGQLRSAGFQVYFISAGLDVLVEVAGDMLGIGAKQRLGSILERVDGKYTGKVTSTYMLKGTVVREWLGAPAYLAFGDSATSDLPFMLDAAGPAFMINPGDRFKKKDLEHAAGRLVEVQYSLVESGKP